MKTNTFQIGDSVRWNDPGISDYDPAEREIQKSRIYTILQLDEEIALISDEYGEAEAMLHELEKI